MDTTVFMEEFFKQVDDIRDNVSSIHKFVNEVKKLHSTILAAPTTDDKVKDELEERMAEIKKTAQKVRQKLKGIMTFRGSDHEEYFLIFLIPLRVTLSWNEIFCLTKHIL